MSTVYPDYYPQFKCIARECKNSCCCGWEIDIDEKALRYYKSVEGEMGKLLAESISEDGGAHFVLGENERCPFLTPDNLCRIIQTLGEECLCQICSDHPRFRNFFSDRSETGLGLCCEAAAELIIKRREKVLLIIDGDEKLGDDELELIEKRNALIAAAQNRNEPIEKRMENILTLSEAEASTCSISEWAERYQELEMLDDTWQNELKALEGHTETEIPKDEASQTAAEQLLAYFLYRHMAGAIDDGDFDLRAAFCVLSCRMVLAMWLNGGDTSLDALADYARRYSAEIEYSEENIGALLDMLFEEAYT